MGFSHRHLLSLRYLTPDDIHVILEHARSLREVLKRPNKAVPTLRGKTVVNLFFEPSTRTSASFETAIHLMGATAMTINVASSSVKKGETLYDTVMNLQAMGASAFVVRHQHSGAPHFIANMLSVPVINAGDGFHEHPTQGLLDLYTMIEKKGSVKGLNVLICGDIQHSRVARSNIWALTTLGAHIYVCGPPTLVPPDLAQLGVKSVTNLRAALPEMDIINVLRVQYERQATAYFPSIREYRMLYGLSESVQPLLKPDALILHPGPMNRGTEIDSALADGVQSVILDQVTNGVAVRMAILYLLLGSSPESAVA